MIYLCVFLYKYNFISIDNLLNPINYSFLVLSAMIHGL